MIVCRAAVVIFDIENLYFQLHCCFPVCIHMLRFQHNQQCNNFSFLQLVLLEFNLFIFVVKIIFEFSDATHEKETYETTNKSLDFLFIFHISVIFQKVPR